MILEELLRITAIESNIIIEKAKQKDYSAFEYAKKQRKYFDVISPMDGFNYWKQIDDYEFCIKSNTSKDEIELSKIYTDLENYIPEVYGNLFKKILLKLQEVINKKAIMNSSYIN